jgi:SAM-dependent methyltransferase
LAIGPRHVPLARQSAKTRWRISFPATASFVKRGPWVNIAGGGHARERWSPGKARESMQANRLPPVRKLDRYAMSNQIEHDYVLGTNDEELERLGLQHRVWRPVALQCWQSAGITIGSRVLDVGAGPGYAALDLAEIVGPTGEVIAVERSARFVQAAHAACEVRGLAHVRLYKLDLMSDSLPVTGCDAAWIRWVASFVSSPAKLMASLAAAIRPGGVAIFHEYVNYASLRVAPRSQLIEEFVQQVMESWRAAGGEPDIALVLPTLMTECGFRVRSATPRVFCARPCDDVWRWPASFIDINLNRLLELGRVNQDWVAAVRREFAATESNPNSLMVTPMVLELIAERCGDGT